MRTIFSTFFNHCHSYLLLTVVLISSLHCKSENKPKESKPTKTTETTAQEKKNSSSALPHPTTSPIAITNKNQPLSENSPTAPTPQPVGKQEVVDTPITHTNNTSDAPSHTNSAVSNLISPLTLSNSSSSSTNHSPIMEPESILSNTLLDSKKTEDFESNQDDSLEENNKGEKSSSQVSLDEAPSATTSYKKEERTPEKNSQTDHVSQNHSDQNSNTNQAQSSLQENNYYGMPIDLLYPMTFYPSQVPTAPQGPPPPPFNPNYQDVEQQNSQQYDHDATRNPYSIPNNVQKKDVEQQDSQQYDHDATRNLYPNLNDIQGTQKPVNTNTYQSNTLSHFSTKEESSLQKPTLKFELSNIQKDSEGIFYLSTKVENLSQESIDLKKMQFTIVFKMIQEKNDQVFSAHIPKEENKMYLPKASESFDLPKKLTSIASTVVTTSKDFFKEIIKNFKKLFNKNDKVNQEDHIIDQKELNEKPEIEEKQEKIQEDQQESSLYQTTVKGQGLTLESPILTPNQCQTFNFPLPKLTEKQREAIRKVAKAGKLDTPKIHTEIIK